MVILQADPEKFHLRNWQKKEIIYLSKINKTYPSKKVVPIMRSIKIKTENHNLKSIKVRIKRTVRFYIVTHVEKKKATISHYSSVWRQKN